MATQVGKDTRNTVIGANTLNLELIEDGKKLVDVYS